MKQDLAGMAVGPQACGQEWRAPSFSVARWHPPSGAATLKSWCEVLLLCSLLLPQTQYTPNSVYRTSTAHCSAGISNIRTGSTTSATTWYFPPDAPATSTSTVLGLLGGACFFHQLEEGIAWGPQDPAFPPGKSHTDFQEEISPPCGPSGYCHLIM